MSDEKYGKLFMIKDLARRVTELEKTVEMMVNYIGENKEKIAELKATIDKIKK